MSRSRTVSLIVGEEFPLIREALAELCRARAGCEVVAQCGDGASAWEAIERLQPDVAFLDLSLPDLSTFEILRRLRHRDLPTRVLVMSTRRDRRTVLDTLRFGAAGYILKSGPPEQLPDALAHIARGVVYVSPLLEVGTLFNSPQRHSVADPIDTLSTREYQVFHLLVDGVRAKEIAARLDLSPKTVDTYRASLMRKLDIHDVAGLVKFAIQRELTSA